MRFVSLFFAFSTLPVFAIDCTAPDICQFLESRILFLGKVLDGGDLTHVRFQVISRSRGLPRGTRTVDVERLELGYVPPPYLPGHLYVVAPYLLDGKLREGPCFAPQEFAEDLQLARTLLSGRLPIHARGYAAMATSPDDVESLLKSGETKAIAGVTISAIHDGRTWTAVTNADGFYVLTLPGPGSYTLHVSSKDYMAGQSDVEVRSYGCAVADFALSSGNSVTGIIRDKRGLPVSDAPVGLIDPDQPAEQRRHSWFYLVHTGSDGGFYIGNIPLGKYLVAVNPDTSSLHSTHADVRFVEFTAGYTQLRGVDLVAGGP